ncbi:MAG: acyl carrier protein [Anaerolineales bacterium]|nr:acyl carrier protein [Anaerolineales bacterium]MCA9930854.1 acyl carrier protein [Anaerolineales bacterium]
MNKKELLERFILDEIMLAESGATIDPDESLISNGVLDSLGLLRLIAFVEEQFGIEVDDGDVIPDNFQSLNVMEKFLAGKN